jgi:hypothetical protein
MYSVLTNNINGYVKHIGDDRHIKNPNLGDAHVINNNKNLAFEYFSKNGEDKYIYEKYIKNSNIENPTYLELLLLEQDFRPNIIRWKVHEIMKGYKILVNGRKFTLEEAFESPTITKLDVISWVQNNRFTDFSMIYEFSINSQIINPAMRDFEESLLENIYVLHSQKKYYKMSKRIFSLARYEKNHEIMEVLSPLFNGDLGRLYIVYGDIGTIEDLFEYENNVPYKKLEFEFDQFKGRLSNISLPSYLAKEKDLFEKINSLVNMEKTLLNKPRILKLLAELKHDLLSLLSKYTEKYLKEKKIFPKYH